jgi:solute:Na+ symporter, SSS family
MRLTVFVFGGCVLIYSIIMEGTPIFELVAMAYQFPVVGAFWPLVCGLYWSRATTQGATWSIVLGMSTWALLAGTALGTVFPSVLGGFIMAGVGMVAGSLAPTRGNREQQAEDRAAHAA